MSASAAFSHATTDAVFLLHPCTRKRFKKRGTVVRIYKIGKKKEAPRHLARFDHVADNHAKVKLPRRARHLPLLQLFHPAQQHKQRGLYYC